jgi:hypothetical protein
MTRFPDWRTQLAEYIAANRGRAFSWGKFDCCMFIAGAVEAMTGDDIARGWRGYRTEDGAAKKLADKGFAHHAEVIASLFPECHPSAAMPGDVVLMADDALGILQGRMVYLVGAAGLGIAPAEGVVKAWHV